MLLTIQYNCHNTHNTGVNVLFTTFYLFLYKANEKIEACSKIADLTGRDIRKCCYDILTSWLNLGGTQNNTQSNVDMDMVGVYLLTGKTLLSKGNLWRVGKTHVLCRVDITPV